MQRQRAGMKQHSDVVVCCEMLYAKGSSQAQKPCGSNELVMGLVEKVRRAGRSAVFYDTADYVCGTLDGEDGPVQGSIAKKK